MGMEANKKWINGQVNKYTVGTLENNWNEDRFDLKYLKESQPLDSQYGHGYGTTYKSFTSNKKQNIFPPETAAKSATNRVVGFPGHQPEIDTKFLKERLNTYETDYRVNYLDPRLKMFPFSLQEMLSQQLKSKQDHDNEIHQRRHTDIEPAPEIDLNKVFSSHDTLPDLNTTFYPPIKYTKEDELPVATQNVNYDIQQTTPDLKNQNYSQQQQIEQQQHEQYNFINYVNEKPVLLSPHNELPNAPNEAVIQNSFTEQYVRPEVNRKCEESSNDMKQKSQKTVTWNESKLVEMSKTPRYENYEN